MFGFGNRWTQLKSIQNHVKIHFNHDIVIYGCGSVAVKTQPIWFEHRINVKNDVDWNCPIFELVRISLLVICAVIFWALTKDLRIAIAFKNDANRGILFYKVVWLFILSTLLGRNTETPTNPIWQSNPIFAGVYVSCNN